MLKSGIITNEQIIELPDEAIISYLKTIFSQLSISDRSAYEKLVYNSLILDERKNLFDFFVGYFNFVIIQNKVVYCSNHQSAIDKIAYVNDGYQVRIIPRIILADDRIQKYESAEEKYLKKVAPLHAINPENDLAFWYPRICATGFKTPKTTIIPFTMSEIKDIKDCDWYKIDRHELLNRVLTYGDQLDFQKEMFMRLGYFSNKFDFSTCHLQSIDELYDKLMGTFDQTFYKLEWLDNLNLVLRTFIKTNYYRPTIYFGLPLNTEFRVFYDFDQHEILDIINYWDTETMINNLKKQEDIQAFASIASELEKSFTILKPYLYSEAKHNLLGVPLEGRWSIDFLYDGQEFFLIDMAHAECSYYYDKILQKK